MLKVKQSSLLRSIKAFYAFLVLIRQILVGKHANWLKSIQLHEIDSLKPFYSLVNPSRRFYRLFTVQITANWGYAMPRNEILSQITAQIAMGAALNHLKSSHTMAADRKKQI